MPSALTYPTGGEYREALYNTKLCFKDPELKGGTVATDKLGMPKPISGALASVFEIQSADGRRWAVKCFTRFVEQQEIRYQRIAETLRTVNKPWRVEFEYIPDGILCRGIWYPVLKMEWVDAIGILPFIENHLWEPVKLADLAAKFAHMVQDLSNLGVAHGDLQHGNLLVTRKDELKLIDYDGMFVPGLANMGACEKGHINYQSPARTMNTWGPYLDNFSAWVIYASLTALTIEPTLWTLLHNQGDEALLFNHDDFADPRSSRAFLALSQSANPDLQALGSALSFLWAPDVRTIPALDPGSMPTLSKQTWNSTTVTSAAPVNSAKPPPAPIPDWVSQVRSRSQAAPSGDQVGATWITGHLPTPPLVPFHPSRMALRVLAGIGLVVIVSSGISAGIGLIPDVIALATAGAMVVAFLIITILMFRHTSEWRSKRERSIIFKECRAESTKAAREVTKIHNSKRDIDSREQKEIDGVTKRVEKGKASEQKELAEINAKLARQVQDLGKQNKRLQTSETTETGQALRALQQQHVANYLGRASIGSAKIPGIGPGNVNSLAANGIYSAADFTGLHYQTGPRGGQQVSIRTSRGLLVHPTGIGEKKAQSLVGWRSGIEGAARATQPSSLPTTQVQSIRTKYVRERQALADQERAARAQASNDQRQVAQKWVLTHAANSGALVTTRQVFAGERAQANLNLTTAQKQADAASWRRELAERESAAYRNVNYRHYLIGIMRS